MPEKADELHRQLTNYLADTGADLRVSNPQFDPANPPLGSREVAIVIETGKEEATVSFRETIEIRDKAQTD